MQEDIYQRDEQKDLKARKRNIFMMILLIVLFLIGILSRWDFVKDEVSSSVDRYINPQSTVTDSTENNNNNK